MRDFFIPRAVAGASFALLQDVRGKPASFNFSAGTPGAGWRDVRYHMDPNFKKQIALPDYVKNLHGDIIVSARCKDLVLGLQPGLECLPITIIDHKGKVASDSHWFLNPRPLIDAIDREASQLSWNRIDPEEICGCERLVLVEARIPEKLHLFRLKHLPLAPVMSATLVDAITAAKLTGIKYTPVEEWDD